MSRPALRSALLAASLLGPALAAQEPGQGVRIGLTYTAGVRPGVYLLPMAVQNADSIRTILARDLDYGDRVAVMAPDSGARPTGPLNYELYARLGAAALVAISETLDGGLTMEVHEVGTRRVVGTRTHALPQPAYSPAWRMAVHGIADAIEEAVTGVRGIASTRILFVRGGTIWTVDSDGANAHAVEGFGRALMPAWSPDATQVAYVELSDAGTQVYVRPLAGGERRRLGFSEGANFSPTFSPDGKSVSFAAGIDGTDIWTASLTGDHGIQRVTVGRGSESDSPSYSPDGRRIAFASGRLGRPEVYIADADGADAQWLTTTGFGDQSYRSNPAWSPDGRHIAFQTQIQYRFQVATINLRDRSVKQLTTEGINEQPSWAPDGRHLLITSDRSGVRQLWVLDIESGRLRQLTHGAMARMGAWSPRLPSLQ